MANKGILDRLLGSPARVAVLRALATIRIAVTGRAAARLAGVSAPQAQAALRRLAELGIVRRQQAGRAGMYQLNRGRAIVSRGLLPLFRAEREILDRALAEFAKRAGERGALSVVLFGSTARNDRGRDSDVDLLVVIPEPSAEIAAGIAAVAESVAGHAGLCLAPLILARSDIKRARGQQRDLLAAIEREGRILYGPSPAGWRRG